MRLTCPRRHVAHMVARFQPRLIGRIRNADVAHFEHWHLGFGLGSHKLRPTLRFVQLEDGFGGDAVAATTACLWSWLTKKVDDPQANGRMKPQPKIASWFGRASNQRVGVMRPRGASHMAWMRAVLLWVGLNGAWVKFHISLRRWTSEMGIFLCLQLRRQARWRHLPQQGRFTAITCRNSSSLFGARPQPDAMIRTK